MNGSNSDNEDKAKGGGYFWYKIMTAIVVGFMAGYKVNEKLIEKLDGGVIFGTSKKEIREKYVTKEAYDSIKNMLDRVVY